MSDYGEVWKLQCTALFLLYAACAGVSEGRNVLKRTHLCCSLWGSVNPTDPINRARFWYPNWGLAGEVPLPTQPIGSWLNDAFF